MTAFKVIKYTFDDETEDHDTTTSFEILAKKIFGESCVKMWMAFSSDMFYGKAEAIFPKWYILGVEYDILRFESILKEWEIEFESEEIYG